MKRILLLLFLFVGISAKASDTLTRAQVYNFSVGDTFDYQISDYYGQKDSLGIYQTTISTISYSRYLIANISYSLDSSSKYIQSERVFPLPDSLETMTLSNLSGLEVLLDTCDGCSYYNISTGPTSLYNGRSADTLSQFVGSPATEELVFVSGLGCAVNSQSAGCGPCGYISQYSTTLVYYAKGTETWGTPYYNLPTSIQELNTTTDKIALFPTLNDGTFEVKMTDANMLPVNLVVYDITGQKIEQRSLSNLSNEVGLGPHSAGIYIWKALSGNQVIQTGKMVVH